jgi:hypothetical protein
MLQAKDIHPIFQGLFTITRTSHIRSLSCSVNGVFQYFTNEFHAWMGQPSSLVPSPTFQSCIHLCLVKLRCSYKYFFTMLGFTGGSMIKRLIKSAWIASHCFGVWCLKLWTYMPKCDYATSCTFYCQYVMLLMISPISFVGILTSVSCPNVTTYLSCISSYWPNDSCIIQMQSKYWSNFLPFLDCWHECNHAFLWCMDCFLKAPKLGLLPNDTWGWH